MQYKPEWADGVGELVVALQRAHAALEALDAITITNRSSDATEYDRARLCVDSAIPLSEQIGLQLFPNLPSILTSFAEAIERRREGSEKGPLSRGRLSLLSCGGTLDQAAERISQAARLAGGVGYSPDSDSQHVDRLTDELGTLENEGRVSLLAHRALSLLRVVTTWYIASVDEYARHRFGGSPVPPKTRSLEARIGHLGLRGEALTHRMLALVERSSAFEPLARVVRRCDHYFEYSLEKARAGPPLYFISERGRELLPELGWAIEWTTGPSSAASAETTSHWYPAAWYAEATDSGLYSDLLRVSASRRLIQRRKVGKHWQYELASVIRKYPQYRHRLEQHREEDVSPERTRTRTND